METPTSFFLSLSLVFLIWFCFYALKTSKSSKQLPPGPYPFPIIGNIFQLGSVFHVSLAELSKTYGPLMTIKLGSKTTIVVSSSETAKQLLLKNDQQFKARTVTDAARALDHDKLSVIWLPALGRWRDLRRLCKEQMFSSERLSASQGPRQQKMQQLCNYLRECCNSGKVVNVGEAAFTTSLNLISNTLFSVDFADYDSSSSQEVKEIVTQVMKVLGALNVADFLPVLRAVDPQGIRRRAKVYLGKLFRSFDGFITQRLQERRRSPLNYSRRDDFLETLLNLNEQNEAEWSYQDIKHLILDLISAGTETTSVTVEWAMTELLRDPGKLRKARNELKEVIGHNKFVQESDISRLPYLQAIVKETLRLHPAATILARQPEEDVEVLDQYIVPKEAQILVNVWAIARDPGQWPNPDSFVPERFLGKEEIDVKGQHFELLPFGTGRRICLGMPLANRMLHLMLATLLHNFDWKLEAGMRPEDIDMTERFGVTVQKAVPLKAIPILDIINGA